MQQRLLFVYGLHILRFRHDFLFLTFTLQHLTPCPYKPFMAKAHPFRHSDSFALHLFLFQIRKRISLWIERCSSDSFSRMDSTSFAFAMGTSAPASTRCIQFTLLLILPWRKLIMRNCLAILLDCFYTESRNNKKEKVFIVCLLSLPHHAQIAENRFPQMLFFASTASL